MYSQTESLLNTHFLLLADSVYSVVKTFFLRRFRLFFLFSFFVRRRAPDESHAFAKRLFLLTRFAQKQYFFSSKIVDGLAARNYIREWRQGDNPCF